jgi:TonB family protein
MRCAIYSVSLAVMFAVCAFAQTDGQPPVSRDQVELTHLSDLTYPPLARMANITGEVEVHLQIRRDGSVESAVVVKGHGQLAPAALKSAEQSTFECWECSRELTPYILTYSFGFGETNAPDWACPADNGIHVTYAMSHVTVSATPFLVHPYFAYVPARSVKCAYLWRCGTTTDWKDWYYYRARSLKCLDLWNCGYRLREPYATCKRLHRRILP